MRQRNTAQDASSRLGDIASHDIVEPEVPASTVGNKQNKPKKKKRKSTNVASILFLMGLLLGVVMLLYPVITDWMATWEAEQSISIASQAAKDAHDPSRDEMERQAKAYNAKMGGLPYDIEPWGYEQQLNYDGSKVISYVEIKKIGCKLPIYHGTDDTVLASGAGHLQISSLPVGGTSSHSVITAHSGMALSRAFDDIRKLEVGDVFVLWTLGVPYAYKVTGSEVVLPEDTKSLVIQPGADLCTLVTCTPYGINSHRLLVHGERCEYNPAMTEGIDMGVFFNSRTEPLLIAAGIIALMFLVLLITALVRRRRQKKYKEDEIRENYEAFNAAKEERWARQRELDEIEAEMERKWER